MNEFVHSKRSVESQLLTGCGIGLGIVFLLIVGAILFPLFVRTGHGSSRRASCQSSLNQIGKACKMYMGDWDGKMPTNRWNGDRNRFLSNACRISDYEYDGSDPQYSANYIEALAPYIAKLDDSRSAKEIWLCPAASEQSYPRSWSAESALTTYCMNWYVAERDETQFVETATTLFFREMDRRAHALLRPHPSFPPNAQHPRGWGPPLHAFPAPNEFGTNDVDPNRHGEGSCMLMADGHVAFFLSNQLLAKPVKDQIGRWTVPGVNIILSP